MLNCLGVAIEQLLSEDVAAASALENGATPYPWTEGALRDSLQAGHCCRQVRCSETITGYGVMLSAGIESQLLNLAVGIQWQRRGIGGALIESLLGEAAANGAAECHLEVRASNLVAQHLYSRHGFAPIGRRKDYYAAGSAREDGILMRAYL
ncbi:MAG: ribosomal protein S18-alanine N-acetyltransferase [Pseudomonadota bacterium]|nr:ribosomal protein S18-alanine N-acetyltransferase [Pseudomonadota bacterium]